MSEGFLRQALKEGADGFQSDWNKHNLIIFLIAQDNLFAQILDVTFDFSPSRKQLEHFLSVVADV